jgi:acetylglutamate kinase
MPATARAAVCAAALLLAPAAAFTASPFPRGAGPRPSSAARLAAAPADALAGIEAVVDPASLAGSLVVVKYGGHAMKDEAGFARDLVALQGLGVKPVVVHGGGPQIKAMLARLGVESEFVGGLRVSNAETVEVAEMVLGKLNKGLVAAIGAAGGRAVGLSGKDDRMIRARRVLAEGGVDIGFVGEAASVDVTLLKALVAMDPSVIPVVAPLGSGETDGLTYNMNADTMAGAVAGALQADRLLLLTDVPGVLDKSGALLPALTPATIDALIEDGTVSGGMIPKLQNAVSAVAQGAGGAAIVDGRNPQALLRALYAANGGTLVSK